MPRGSRTTDVRTSTRLRRTTALAATVLIGALSAACAGGGSDDAPTTITGEQVDPSSIHAVVLGDSYSSGEGVGPYDLDETCHRSSASWGGQLDESSPELQVVASFACSGARSSHVASEPFTDKDQAPQAEQLKDLVESGMRVDLVLLTVGGNDIGFSNALRFCVALSCADAQQLDPGQLGDTYGDLFASTVLPAVRAAAPDADVVLVGYPRLLPAKQADTAGCSWLEPAEREGLNRAAAALQESGEKLADPAAGISFVPSLDAFSGHELCSDDAYIHALQSANGSESAHPTQAGQALWASHIREQLLAQDLLDSRTA